MFEGLEGKRVRVSMAFPATDIFGIVRRNGTKIVHLDVEGTGANNDIEGTVRVNVAHVALVIPIK